MPNRFISAMFGLARVAVDQVELAPVDHRRGAEPLAELDLVLGRDDRDGVRAVQPAQLQRHRAEPAAGAPHEHVVAGLHAGLVDQHAVGREVDERVGRRLLPRQVLRLRHELLRLDARVVGERAPVGLVAPDLLLRAGHRVEAVALRALAARLVAVDDDLVAGLPALDARTDGRDDARGIRAADVEIVAGIPEDGHRLAHRRPHEVVVHTRRHHPHEHLARPGFRHLDGLELHRVDRLAEAFGRITQARIAAGTASPVGSSTMRSAGVSIATAYANLGGSGTATGHRARRRRVAEPDTTARSFAW